MGNDLASDAISQLGRCCALEELFLGDTEVDDAVVDYLIGLPALRHLYVVDTNISQQGLERLRRHVSLVVA